MIVVFTQTYNWNEWLSLERDRKINEILEDEL
jgi:hypothetical protein